MNGSMSVSLVFVWSDRPDRLEGKLVGGIGAGDLRPTILCPQEYPLALPPRQRRNDLTGDQSSRWVFGVVPTCPGDPALAQLVGCAHVVPESRATSPGVLLSQREQFAAQRPFAV